MKHLHPLRLSCLLLAAAIPCTPELHAQEAWPADAEARERVIEGIGERMVDGYIFLDKAEACRDLLRERLAAGAYDGIRSDQDFARQLTRDLQGLTEDGHLRVLVRSREPQGEPVPREEQERRRLERSRLDNYGVHRIEIARGNVGCLELGGFAWGGTADETVHAAMRVLANCDAFVLDLRSNGGGAPEMVQLINSYLFEERTLINSLYYRAIDEKRDYWTHERLPGPRLTGVPVFVLTSRRTFSAAEECSYNLQCRKRATLVGETTGGGAHPGGTTPIDDYFALWLPRGRAINPVTGINWEGTGVVPEVPVRADAALDEALVLAEAAAERYRSERGDWREQPADRLAQALAQAQELVATEGPEAALAHWSMSLQFARAFGALDRDGFDLLALEVLDSGEMELAAEVLAYAVATYPEDLPFRLSYGECLTELERAEAARAQYRRALELHPDSDEAKAALEGL